MRQVKTIELPISGYKVDVITHWTLDEFMQIEQANSKVAKRVKVVDGKDFEGDFDGDALGVARRLALTLAVKKIVDKEGVELPVTYDNIGSLHLQDGLLIRAEIDALEGDAKKK